MHGRTLGATKLLNNTRAVGMGDWLVEIKKKFNFELKTKISRRCKWEKLSDINFYISIFTLTDKWPKWGITPYNSFLLTEIIYVMLEKNYLKNS